MWDDVAAPLALQNHLLQARHLTTAPGEWMPQYAQAWAGRARGSSGGGGGGASGSPGRAERPRPRMARVAASAPESSRVSTAVLLLLSGWHGLVTCFGFKASERVQSSALHPPRVVSAGQPSWPYICANEYSELVIPEVLLQKSVCLLTAMFYLLYFPEVMIQRHS